MFFAYLIHFIPVPKKTSLAIWFGYLPDLAKAAGNRANNFKLISGKNCCNSALYLFPVLSYIQIWYCPEG
jgi:hypothetical protein